MPRRHAGHSSRQSPTVPTSGGFRKMDQNRSRKKGMWRSSAVVHFRAQVAASRRKTGGAYQAGRLLRRSWRQSPIPGSTASGASLHGAARLSGSRLPGAEQSQWQPHPRDPRTRRARRPAGAGQAEGHRTEAGWQQGRRALPDAAGRPVQCPPRGHAVPVRADRRRNRTAPARQPAALRLAHPQAGQRDRRGGLAGGRDHRLALPVLHLREEGRGHRQGGQERGHPRRHPALHPQLDRQVPGAEHARSAVAGHLSRTRRSGRRWSTTSSPPSRPTRCRRN